MDPTDPTSPLNPASPLYLFRNNGQGVYSEDEFPWWLFAIAAAILVVAAIALAVNRSVD